MCYVSLLLQSEIQITVATSFTCFVTPLVERTVNQSFWGAGFSF